MKMTLRLSCAAWSLLLAKAYDMTHMIDPMPVVCPLLQKPSPLPAGVNDADWPTKQQFEMSIQPDFNMLVDKPYVLTFLRTAKKAVTIEYEMKDANNKVMLKKQKITLQDTTTTTASSSACTCLGSNTGVDAAKYGATYGKTCVAHDNVRGNCTGLEAACCKAWCYVSKDCPTALASEVASGLWFSYGACSSTPAAANCLWTPKNNCECKNVDAIINPGSRRRRSPKALPMKYGEICAAHDDGKKCGERYTDDILGEWCCQNWCWVGAECETGIPARAPPEALAASLFWSVDACTNDPAKVATCPYKASDGSSPAEFNASAVDPRCECMGWAPSLVTSGRRRAGKAFPTDYGAQCKAHDKTDCAALYPKENTSDAIWCCQNWCYVDEECPTASASWVFPGSFFSYAACKDDGPTLGGCGFSDACKPQTRPSSIALTTKTPAFPSTYGNTCQVHDNTNCKAWWGENLTASDDMNWCCDQWSWVRSDCPFAEESDITGLYYSYKTCKEYAAGETRPTFTYASGTCSTRRLEGQEEELDWQEGDQDEEEEAEPASAEERFLASSRRRAASTSSSSSSGRRRASRTRPSAPAPRPSARRRAPSSVPADSGRRRAAAAPPPPPAPTGQLSSQPRRRTHAAPASSPASADQRRRQPATDAIRRRETSRRRSAAAVSANPEARRRAQSIYGNSHSTGGSNYGYTTQSATLQNFQNTAPSRVDYGLSGQGQKTGSKMPVLMGAAAGVAAGGLMGVGGYYAYQRMTENNWNADASDRSWCRSPPGNLMRCADCFQKYTSTQCKNENSCFEGQGCQFELPKDTQRDELLQAGFVPMDFTAPFKVTISKIEGDDFTQAKVCPAAQPDAGGFTTAWEEASSFSADLFMTFTEMDTLGEVCNRVPSTIEYCTSDAQCGGVGFMCYGDSCVCKPGYCTGTATNGVQQCVMKLGTASAAFSMQVNWLLVALASLYFFHSPRHAVRG
eukprot:TRINITY_DN11030_c0_g1_i3.p1 TRINITY_DN11030_c0_g1~~TRINITY_DN11030_c0_g1_i3.p1  ORF type:complete len:971 (+),score=189.22 TRINITY_DN11030_c0_g1_i3:83-2995(+)